MYRFYFCNIKTTITRNSFNSNGKSYFDFNRAKKSRIDNGFGRKRSTTGSFTENPYAFARQTSCSPIIDSVFDSESELGIRNPVYDTLYGRERADTPHESGRPTPDNVSQASTENPYSLARQTSCSPIIDSVFDSESELGIRNPVYDTLYGRERADTPHESGRPTPDNVSQASIPSTATIMHHENHIYATISDIEESGRPTPPIEEDKCSLQFRHKISIVLIVFLGNV